MSVRFRRPLHHLCGHHQRKSNRPYGHQIFFVTTVQSALTTDGYALFHSPYGEAGGIISSQHGTTCFYRSGEGQGICQLLKPTADETDIEPGAAEQALRFVSNTPHTPRTCVSQWRQPARSPMPINRTTVGSITSIVIRRCTVMLSLRNEAAVHAVIGLSDDRLSTTGKSTENTSGNFRLGS